MRAIIAGGGKVGYYLLKTLTDKKYKVTLIEKDRDICNKIAEEVNADIICGDASDIEVLKDANIEDTEIVAAVTGKDEENLVICQMAKINFNIGKTIARINNPKNRPIFKALGVDKTVCSTEVIAYLIEGEFTSEKLRTVQTLERGKMILVELIVEKGYICEGKAIMDLELPIECVIASIIRNDDVVYPKGHTVIKTGDKVLIVTTASSKTDVEKLLIG